MVRIHQVMTEFRQLAAPLNPLPDPYELQKISPVRKEFLHLEIQALMITVNLRRTGLRVRKDTLHLLHQKEVPPTLLVMMVTVTVAAMIANHDQAEAEEINYIY